LQIFVAAKGGSLSVVWDMELYENGEGLREKCNEMHCPHDVMRPPSIQKIVWFLHKFKAPLVCFCVLRSKGWDLILLKKSKPLIS
jgi:hypothetical protein